MAAAAACAKVALESYFATDSSMPPMQLVHKLSGDGLASNPFHMLSLMNSVYKQPATGDAGARDAAPGARDAAHGAHPSVPPAATGGLRGGPNPFARSSTAAASSGFRNWRHEAHEESKERRTPYARPVAPRARSTGADVGRLDALSQAEKDVWWMSTGTTTMTVEGSSTSLYVIAPKPAVEIGGQLLRASRSHMLRRSSAS